MKINPRFVSRAGDSPDMERVRLSMENSWSRLQRLYDLGAPVVIIKLEQLLLWKRRYAVLRGANLWPERQDVQDKYFKLIEDENYLERTYARYSKRGKYEPSRQIRPRTNTVGG